jgi:hypothetical protein
MKECQDNMKDTELQTNKDKKTGHKTAQETIPKQGIMTQEPETLTQGQGATQETEIILKANKEKQLTKQTTFISDIFNTQR